MGESLNVVWTEFSTARFSPIRYQAFTFTHAMQNGPNLLQILLRPLPKFGDKVLKIFWTQTLGLGWILFHFISFTNKIFRSAWISQLPTCSIAGLTFVLALVALTGPHLQVWHAVVNVIKLFYVSTMAQGVKLKCLSLESIFNLDRVG